MVILENSRGLLGPPSPDAETYALHTQKRGLLRTLAGHFVKIQSITVGVPTQIVI